MPSVGARRENRLVSSDFSLSRSSFARAVAVSAGVSYVARPSSRRTGLGGPARSPVHCRLLDPCDLRLRPPAARPRPLAGWCSAVHRALQRAAVRGPRAGARWADRGGGHARDVPRSTVRATPRYLVPVAAYRNAMTRRGLAQRPCRDVRATLQIEATLRWRNRRRRRAGSSPHLRLGDDRLMTDRRPSSSLPGTRSGCSSRRRPDHSVRLHILCYSDWSVSTSR